MKAVPEATKLVAPPVVVAAGPWPYQAVVGWNHLHSLGAQVRRILPQARKVAVLTDSATWGRLSERVRESFQEAGLEVTDRIALTLDGDGTLIDAARAYEDYIAGETLATQVSYESLNGASPVTVDGREVPVTEHAVRGVVESGDKRGAGLGWPTANLPVASGIGGGSADAAATLRALARLWKLPLPDPAAVLRLGADVPVCLAGRAVRMQGVGEVLTALPPLPPCHLVLVNPRQAVATPAVFKALGRKDNPALPTDLPGFETAADFAQWLADQRNDLEPPALRLAPVIGTVKAALMAQDGCLLARMSGSGATCFGLFADAAAAAHAARRLKAAQPGWWVAAAAMVS